jgi:hypothetical protein
MRSSSGLQSITSCAHTLVTTSSAKSFSKASVFHNYLPVWKASMTLEHAAVSTLFLETEADIGYLNIDDYEKFSKTSYLSSESKK